jgi:hypothetical protein
VPAAVVDEEVVAEVSDVEVGAGLHYRLPDR